MIHIKKILLSATIMAVVSITALPGDYAHFHFIGFSRDARYLAFEEFGITDYEGQAYSSIYVIDTEKNLFAASPFRTVGKRHRSMEDEEKFSEPVRKETRQKANAQLKRFGIVDGNTGVQVAAHLINEYSNGDQNKSSEGLPLKVAFTKRGNPLYREGYWEIELKEVATGEEKYGEKLMSFEMTIKNENNDMRVVQRAGKVPKDRGDATGYAIQEVFLYHNRLAIFVGVFSRGWEGDDMRLMAVTTRLE